MPPKRSIPYSQILHVKRIFTVNSELDRNCKVLQEQFTKRGYNSSLIQTEKKKIKLLHRKELIILKATQKVTYNRHFLKKQIIQNHRSILMTSKFFNWTSYPFHKNKILKLLIRGNTIQDDKNIKKSNKKYEGKSTPCISCYILNKVSVLFTGTKRTFMY